MFLKKLLVFLLIDILLTSACFGKVIEANPGERFALTLDQTSRGRSLKNNDIAITYTSLSGFSISTHTIPFKYVDSDRILNPEEHLSIVIPENIKSGEYEIDAYLIENNKNNIKYYNINSDIERIIIKKSTSSTQPYLLKSDLDKSRVILSEEALHITLNFLAPKSGFPKLFEVEAIIKDHKDNSLIKTRTIIESRNRFGTMEIPVSFDILSKLESDSYEISVTLKSSKGLIGLLNSLSNLSDIPDYTYDLGEIHILNANTNNKQGKTLHIGEFGASPNDNVDDTTAIIEAIAALKRAGGGTLIFEPGTYVHSDVLRIENITNFAIKGKNTRLVASNSERSAVIFKECSNFSFSGFQLLSPESDSRRQEFESTALSVLTSEKFTISNNLIYQAAAAGLMVSRESKYYQIHDNTIIKTRADAIHSTGASAYGAIFNNITMGNGDDGIAVVSYINSKGNTHHIRIFNNNILGNYHGRGIAVVGGNNISIINNQIQDTSFAGILVASEHYYNTYGNNEVLISDNNIINACQNDKNTHPAILIYGRENKSKYVTNQATDVFLSTENILAKNNHIQSPKCISLLRLGPSINNISIQKNMFNTVDTVIPIILNESEYSSFTLVGNM